MNSPNLNNQKQSSMNEYVEETFRIIDGGLSIWPYQRMVFVIGCLVAGRSLSLCLLIERAAPSAERYMISFHMHSDL